MLGKQALQIAIRLCGVALILLAVASGLTSEESLHPGQIFHWASFAFISAGLLGIVLASYPYPRVISLFRNLCFDSPTRRAMQIARVATQLEDFTAIYYERNGRDLDKAQKGTWPGIWKSVIRGLGAKISIHDLKTILAAEGRHRVAELTRQGDILSTLVATAPSFGIMGTVLGLIKLLAHMDDVATLGPNISLAFIMTFYGIFLSLAVFRPLGAYIKGLKEAEIEALDQAFFWLDLVAQQKAPSYCALAHGAPAIEARPAVVLARKPVYAGT